jgi:hypothetical protein
VYACAESQQSKQQWINTMQAAAALEVERTSMTSFNLNLAPKGKDSVSSMTLGYVCRCVNVPLVCTRDSVAKAARTSCLGAQEVKQNVSSFYHPTRDYHQTQVFLNYLKTLVGRIEASIDVYPGDESEFIEFGSGSFSFVDLFQQQ